MRISDWSSDVCSSDLHRPLPPMGLCGGETCLRGGHRSRVEQGLQRCNDVSAVASPSRQGASAISPPPFRNNRSEEHTSELQSLMRNSYAVFCLKKKTTNTNTTNIKHTEQCI